MHSHFVNDALILLSTCCFASQSIFRRPLSVVTPHSAHFHATTFADITASICSSAASCASNSASARWRFASRSLSTRLTNLERICRTESFLGSAATIAAGGSARPNSANFLFDVFLPVGTMAPPNRARAASMAHTCISSSQAIWLSASSLDPGSGMPFGNLFNIIEIALRFAISSAVAGMAESGACASTPGSATPSRLPQAAARVST
mmetsp:Transcript_59931/g.172889  ORF Transcript_59931/g.172889 Transcript_59931/m.172889 type:complete len:207 (-) Transcript_59931:1389-2009(-)